MVIAVTPSPNSVGLIGTLPSGDLIGTIQGVVAETPKKDLSALIKGVLPGNTSESTRILGEGSVYTAVSNTTPDLVGSIFGVDTSQNQSLFGLYTATLINVLSGEYTRVPPSTDLFGIIRPVSESSTNNNSNIIGSIEGIFTSNTSLTPDLVGFYTSFNPPQENSLNGSLRALQSDNTENFLNGISDYYQGGIVGIDKTTIPDLVGIIQVAQTQNLLEGFIRPLQADTEDLSGYLRVTDSGDALLSGFIDGQAEKDLFGFIRPLQSGDNLLEGNIEAVPPLNLTGIIQGVLFEELEGNYLPNLPINLTGSYIPTDDRFLEGVIDGQAEFILEGVIQSQGEFVLEGTYRGVGSGVNTLSGFVFASSGTDDNTLSGSYETVLGTQEIELSGFYSVGFPLDLSGVYERIGPAVLEGFIQTSDNLTLNGEYSPVFPSGSLFGQITATGDFSNIFGIIQPVTSDVLELEGFIESQGINDLIGEINSTVGANLKGNIETSSTIFSTLEATVAASMVEDLLGYYEITESQVLKGNVDVNSGNDLTGEYTPKVFYIDSSIPINTFLVNSLKGIINATPCDFQSSSSNLSAVITSTFAEDLVGTVIGLQGQYAESLETLELEFKELPVAQNVGGIVTKSLAFSEAVLEILLTKRNIGDLSGTITAVQSNNDLIGQITPRFFSNLVGDSVTPATFLNEKTGETKDISVFFRGDARNYYYSALAGKTFSYTPDQKIEVVVQAYEETETPNILSTRGEVRQCVVDNLEDFESIDDAVRYAIKCALSLFSSDLTAFISSKGQTNDLRGFIAVNDRNTELEGKYISVNNSPDLAGNIESSGGFYDLSVNILGVTTDNVDIQGTIEGIIFSDLPATISGAP